MVKHIAIFKIFLDEVFLMVCIKIYHYLKSFLVISGYIALLKIFLFWKVHLIKTKLIDIDAV